MSVIAHPHLEVDQNDVARFAGTRFKVLDVVIEHIIWKWPAEAIQLQHPELSLSQVHSALAYYYDNRALVDAQIQERERKVEEVRQHTEDRELQARLRKRLGDQVPPP